MPLRRSRPLAVATLLTTSAVGVAFAMPSSSLASTSGPSVSPTQPPLGVSANAQPVSTPAGPGVVVAPQPGGFGTVLDVLGSDGHWTTSSVPDGLVTGNVGNQLLLDSGSSYHPQGNQFLVNTTTGHVAQGQELMDYPDVFDVLGAAGNDQYWVLGENSPGSPSYSEIAVHTLGGGNEHVADMSYSPTGVTADADGLVYRLNHTMYYLDRAMGRTVTLTGQVSSTTTPGAGPGVDAVLTPHYVVTLAQNPTRIVRTSRATGAESTVIANPVFAITGATDTAVAWTGEPTTGGTTGSTGEEATTTGEESTPTTGEEATPTTGGEEATSGEETGGEESGCSGAETGGEEGATSGEESSPTTGEEATPTTGGEEATSGEETGGEESGCSGGTGTEGYGTFLTAIQGGLATTVSAPCVNGGSALVGVEADGSFLCTAPHGTTVDLWRVTLSHPAGVKLGTAPVSDAPIYQGVLSQGRLSQVDGRDLGSLTAQDLTRAGDSLNLTGASTTLESRGTDDYAQSVAVSGDRVARYDGQDEVVIGGTGPLSAESTITAAGSSVQLSGPRVLSGTTLYDRTSGTTTQTPAAGNVALWGPYVAAIGADNSVTRTDLRTGQTTTVVAAPPGCNAFPFPFLRKISIYDHWIAVNAIAFCSSGSVFGGSTAIYEVIDTDTGAVTPLSYGTSNDDGQEWKMGPGVLLSNDGLHDVRSGTDVVTSYPMGTHLLDVSDDAVLTGYRGHLTATALPGAQPAPLDLGTVAAPGVTSGSTWSLDQTSSSTLASGSVTITDADGTVVRTLTPVLDHGELLASWDTKDDSGSLVGNGTYMWTVTGANPGGELTEPAGTGTTAVTGTVTVSGYVAAPPVDTSPSPSPSADSPSPVDTSPSSPAPSTVAPSSDDPSTTAPSSPAPSSVTPSSPAPSSSAAPSTVAPTSKAPSSPAPSSSPAPTSAAPSSSSAAPSSPAPSSSAPPTTTPVKPVSLPIAISLRGALHYDLFSALPGSSVQILRDSQHKVRAVAARIVVPGAQGGTATLTFALHKASRGWAGSVRISDPLAKVSVTLTKVGTPQESSLVKGIVTGKVHGQTVTLRWNLPRSSTTLLALRLKDFL